MKAREYGSREEWLDARKGRITGSRLKDIVVKRGKGRKIGFYELIAERLGLPPGDESAMARGSRLEPEAIEAFEHETGKEVDTSLVIWERDDNRSIAISPDGIIGETEAVEAKCLSSARHLQAYLEGKVPDEYEFQVLQYFIVNEKLERLYFCFYDPRVLCKPFFWLEIPRKEVQDQVDTYLAYQRETLEEVDRIVNSLTF